MFFYKTPLLIRWLYPELIWSAPTKEKIIYLTFDDGPVPQLTAFILKTLDTFKARATFFCVGDNLRKYPHIAQRTIESGHTLGNHTYNHLNGWKTDGETYVNNIHKCEEGLKKYKQGKKLLRPPYGKISRKQIGMLKSDYRIIMWDVLTGDYDDSLKPEQCLAGSIRATRKGSIVLFHDNPKAEKNMKYALPRYLDHFSSKGFQFKAL